MIEVLVTVVDCCWERMFGATWSWALKEAIMRTHYVHMWTT